MDYLLEVADWCTEDQRPATIIHADTDDGAIAHATKTLGDPYNWAILPDQATEWAWPDGKTLRGWNYTGSHGTYQMRLRRAE